MGKRKPKKFGRTSVVTARSQTPTCPSCGGDAHVGDSEETLAVIDPEAAVFYDRDVADTDLVVGLCGPRFRMSGGRLYAHYGSPAWRCIYKAFVWDPTKQSWIKVIDTSKAPTPQTDDDVGSAP